MNPNKHQVYNVWGLDDPFIGAQTSKTSDQYVHDNAWVFFGFVLELLSLNRLLHNPFTLNSTAGFIAPSTRGMSWFWHLLIWGALASLIPTINTYLLHISYHSGSPYCWKDSWYPPIGGSPMSLSGDHSFHLNVTADWPISNISGACLKTGRPER